MSRIRVSIDSLILKGFHLEDRQAIAAGLEQELARLLRDSEHTAVPTMPGGIRHMNPGSVVVEPAAPPRRIGAAAARQIGKGLRS